MQLTATQHQFLLTRRTRSALMVKDTASFLGYTENHRQHMELKEIRLQKFIDAAVNFGLKC